MKARFLALGMAAVSAMAPPGWAQPQQPDGGQEAPRSPTVMEGSAAGSQRGPQGRMRGALGKITAIQNASIEIAGPDGTKTSFKLTGNTEFRKDRQPAKIADFKVGDMVIVRTDPDLGNPGNAAGATALMVAAAPQGFAGRDGAGRSLGAGFVQGSLGKDYVVGEVKNVDPPKLTVMRIDNITQTLELNEETSLRRGRNSITMTDIQAGDYIFVRGAVANDAFVPKSVSVIPPEMWKRLQEMNAEGGSQGAAPLSPQQKPPERPN